MGLPGGPCPTNRHDRSVQNGIGDLMLCPDCDRVRREEDRLLHQSTHVDKTKEQTTAAVTTNGARAASLRQTASHTASVMGSQSHATTGPANDADTATSSGGDGGPRDKRRSKKTLQSTPEVLTSSLPPIYSELLQYINCHRDKSTHDALKRVALSFFTPDEIADSKRQLVTVFSTELEGCTALTDRRKSATRSVHEAELDDIFCVLDSLDSKDLLDKRVVFAAVHWDRIPKYGPEETNSCAVLDRQMQLEATVASLADVVSRSVGADATQGLNAVQSPSLEALKVTITDIDSQVALHRASRRKLLS